MRKAIFFIVSLLVCLMAGTKVSEAQILKGFGKKLEKKIEERIERKADRQFDNVLDKADRKTDEPIDYALKPKNKASNAEITSLKTPFEAVEARPDQALVLVGSSCQDFSWFKKGTLLAYETLDKNGKVEGGITMQVRDLTNKGSATIAEVDATVSSSELDEMVYRMNYICDGEMLYMDIASMMKAMMEKNPEMKNRNVPE